MHSPGYASLSRLVAALCFLDFACFAPGLFRACLFLGLQTGAFPLRPREGLAFVCRPGFPPCPLFSFHLNSFALGAFKLDTEPSERKKDTLHEPVISAACPSCECRNHHIKTLASRISRKGAVQHKAVHPSCRRRATASHLHELLQWIWMRSANGPAGCGQEFLFPKPARTT